MKLLTVFFATAVFHLAGCTPQPPEPLSIGTCVRIGCEPLYLARDLGYYGTAPIRVVEYASGTEVLRAFRNGAVAAAVLSLDEVLLLAQAVPDVRIVLVLNFSNGADVVLGRPPLQSLADIRGTRVGVENTALGAYVLSRALDVAGLTPDQLTLVPLPIDQHERAYREHRVDALVTYEPVQSRIKAAGARVLFDSRQIPGEMMNVLVVRAEYLHAHPEIVQGLLRGWFRALAYVEHDRADGIRRMALDRAMSTQEFPASLEGYRFPNLDENRWLFAGEPCTLETRIDALSAVLVERGLLRGSIKAHGILDGGLLDAISLERPIGVRSARDAD